MAPCHIALLDHADIPADRVQVVELSEAYRAPVFVDEAINTITTLLQLPAFRHLSKRNV